MVGRAHSENVKAIQNRTEYDRRMKEAVHAVQLQQAYLPKSRKSIRKIAASYNVKDTTLGRHVRKATKSMTEHLASQQKLSPVQEGVLVDLIKTMADRALPLNRADIQKYAQRMMNPRRLRNGPKPGKNWVSNFLDRHYDDLSTHWSSPLDTRRARALSPKAVEDHFRCVRNTELKYNIEKDCDYGMDETSIPLGRVARTRVVGRRGTKTQHSRQQGNRECVTVVETICADGTSTPPTVVFKGKTFDKRWGGKNNPIGAV
jgi:hypothetical protein